MSRTEEEWQAVEIASAVWRRAIVGYDRDICAQPVSIGQADDFLTYFNSVASTIVQTEIARAKETPDEFSRIHDHLSSIDWTCVESLVELKLNRMCLVFVAIVREDNPEFMQLSPAV